MLLIVVHVNIYFIVRTDICETASANPQSDQ